MNRRALVAATALLGSARRVWGSIPPRVDRQPSGSVPPAPAGDPLDDPGDPGASVKVTLMVTVPDRGQALVGCTVEEVHWLPSAITAGHLLALDGMSGTCTITTKMVGR